jgi:putative membrane protein
MISQGNRKYKFILLIIFLIILVLSCIKPVYPTEMFLQHSVTLVMVIILAVITGKNALSDRSFGLIIAFMILHVIGARWIYSYVPYDEWLRSITGITFSGSSRNHYDRFVHLMFGLIMFYPFKEIYIKWFGCPEKFSGILAFLTITGCSLVYEVFEWGLTLVLSPQDAEDYNGQQGDLWDAQKDMALALSGAFINLVINSIKGCKRSS